MRERVVRNIQMQQNSRLDVESVNDSAKRSRQFALRRRTKEFVQHFRLPIELYRPLYRELSEVPTWVRAQEWKVLRGLRDCNPGRESPATSAFNDGITEYQRAALGTYGRLPEDLTVRERDALRKSAPTFLVRRRPPRPGRPDIPYPDLVRNYVAIISRALAYRPTRPDMVPKTRARVLTSPFDSKGVDVEEVVGKQCGHKEQAIPHSHSKHGHVTRLLQAALGNALFVTPAPKLSTLSKWITKNASSRTGSLGK